MITTDEFEHEYLTRCTKNMKKITALKFFIRYLREQKIKVIDDESIENFRDWSIKNRKIHSEKSIDKELEYIRKETEYYDFCVNHGRIYL